MEFWILVIIALLVSAIGFYKYVYFISLGYGFSIAAMGVGLIIMYKDSLTLWTVLACILFVIYGCRLGGYLLIREIKSKSYGAHMKKEIKSGKGMNFGVKVAIWVTCVLLYVLEVAPVYIRMANGGKVDTVCIVGIVIMIIGLIIESLADVQKSRTKAVNPNDFCSKGLYRMVRCPNYFGEVIFWTGVFISGITTYASAIQWTMAVLGYVGIVYVMFSGARRLEIRQNKNYGDREDYQKYVKSTPILIPLIPLYSVEKHKWLVA
ncbi:MAG: DUF1295 domain-containing protein [Lachnospiraceae bacterium]|nr:DUF1295 domain-containing protein [Lachnospiraceae bacterium]